MGKDTPNKETFKKPWKDKKSIGIVSLFDPAMAAMATGPMLYQELEEKIKKDEAESEEGLATEDLSTGKITDEEALVITDEQRRRLLRRTMYAQQTEGTTTGATKLGV